MAYQCLNITKDVFDAWTIHIICSIKTKIRDVIKDIKTFENMLGVQVNWQCDLNNLRTSVTLNYPINTTLAVEAVKTYQRKKNNKSEEVNESKAIGAKLPDKNHLYCKFSLNNQGRN